MARRIHYQDYFYPSREQNLTEGILVKTQQILEELSSVNGKWIMDEQNDILLEIWSHKPKNRPPSYSIRIQVCNENASRVDDHYFYAPYGLRELCISLKLMPADRILDPENLNDFASYVSALFGVEQCSG